MSQEWLAYHQLEDIFLRWLFEDAGHGTGPEKLTSRAIDDAARAIVSKGVKPRPNLVTYLKEVIDRRIDAKKYFQSLPQTEELKRNMDGHDFWLENLQSVHSVLSAYGKLVEETKQQEKEQKGPDTPQRTVKQILEDFDIASGRRNAEEETASTATTNDQPAREREATNTKRRNIKDTRKEVDTADCITHLKRLREFVVNLWEEGAFGKVDMVTVALSTLMAKDLCFKTLSLKRMWDKEHGISNKTTLATLNSIMQPPEAKISRETDQNVVITMRQGGIERTHRYWLDNRMGHDEGLTEDPEGLQDHLPIFMAISRAVKEYTAEEDQNKATVERWILFAALEGWDVPLAPSTRLTHCGDAAKATKRMLKDQPAAVRFLTDTRNLVLEAIAMYKASDLGSYWAVRLPQLAKDNKAFPIPKDPRRCQTRWTWWAIGASNELAFFTLGSSETGLCDTYELDPVSAASMLAMAVSARKVFEHNIVMATAPTAMTVEMLRPEESPNVPHSAKILMPIVAEAIAKAPTNHEKVGVCRATIEQIDKVLNPKHTIKRRIGRIEHANTLYSLSWAFFTPELLNHIYGRYPWTPGEKDVLQRMKLQLIRENCCDPRMNQLHQFFGKDPEEIDVTLQKTPLVMDPSIHMNWWIYPEDTDQLPETLDSLAPGEAAFLSSQDPNIEFCTAGVEVMHFSKPGSTHLVRYREELWDDEEYSKCSHDQLEDFRLAIDSKDVDLYPITGWPELELSPAEQKKRDKNRAKKERRKQRQLEEGLKEPDSHTKEPESSAEAEPADQILNDVSALDLESPEPSSSQTKKKSKKKGKGKGKGKA